MADGPLRRGTRYWISVARVNMNPLFRRLSSVVRIDQRPWALMTLYERFEQLVAIALSLIIAVLPRRLPRWRR
jgi:hypothetical protein